MTALSVSACIVASGAHAQDARQGITSPRSFAAFDERAPGCGAPPGLERVLAFVQDNGREFMQGVSRGLALAARDQGLRFERALADNDGSRMIAQVQQLRERKVGAIVAAPIDPSAMSPHLQEFLRTGGYVGTIVPPPATTILNAPQYLTGQVLANEAVQHIRARLGGRARVVLLTHDSLQFLSPRFTAMRDALRALPGVSIVADISPLTVDKQGGQAMMQTILLAQPSVDVVLGADTVVLGALAALRAAGRERPDQFLGGIDGEPEAVAEIRKGGAYKASVSLASPVFGYALGWFAGGWLDGKSVPQAMDILPYALNAQNIARYERDLAEPDKVYADPARRRQYLRMYGNICYDTRDAYVNFPWSSEQP